ILTYSATSAKALFHRPYSRGLKSPLPRPKGRGFHLDTVTLFLSGNSCQRILRRLIPGCQSQGCAILSSGALSVPLFFQQGAKQVVGLEGRRVLGKIISGKIAAEDLDCAGIVAPRLQQCRSRIKERRVVFALRAGGLVQG